MIILVIGIVFGILYVLVQGKKTEGTR